MRKPKNKICRQPIQHKAALHSDLELPSNICIKGEEPPSGRFDNLCGSHLQIKVIIIIIIIIILLLILYYIIWCWLQVQNQKIREDAQVHSLPVGYHRHGYMQSLVLHYLATACSLWCVTRFEESEKHLTALQEDTLAIDSLSIAPSNKPAS